MTNSHGDELKIAIKNEIKRRGIQYKEAASEIGVTRAYLGRILCKSGKLPTNNSNRLRIIARFLQVSDESVYRMLGIINQPECAEADQSLVATLAESHRRMLHNQRWHSGAPTTEEWNSMTIKQRLFVSRLFEQACYDDFQKRTSPGKQLHHRRTKT